MIGRYLALISPEAESDILTGNMVPGCYGDRIERCLVGWATDTMSGTLYQGRILDWHQTRSLDRRPVGKQVVGEGVEHRYDALCRRFGVDRTNTAIRNRICENMTRRELALRVVAVA